MPENIKRSDRILAELKRRRLENDIVDVEEKCVKLVIFSLNDMYYAFPGSDVKEILTFEEIYPVPGCPDFILGIINVRGTVQSVLSLRRIMGFPDPEADHHSRIILAGKGEICSGILVDSVDHVEDVPERQINPPITAVEKTVKEFITGQTQYDQKDITLLDVKKIFSHLLS